LIEKSQGGFSSFASIKVMEAKEENGQDKGWPPE